MLAYDWLAGRFPTRERKLNNFGYSHECKCMRDLGHFKYIFGMQVFSLCEYLSPHALAHLPVRTIGRFYILMLTHALSASLTSALCRSWKCTVDRGSGKGIGEHYSTACRRVGCKTGCCGAVGYESRRHTVRNHREN